MKFLIQFCRVIVGLLFILSGLLKLNDPTGFSYKLEEYFTVFAGDVETQQDSLRVAVSFGSGTPTMYSREVTTSDSILPVVFTPSLLPMQVVEREDGTLDSIQRMVVNTLVEGFELRSDTFIQTIVTPHAHIRVLSGSNELSAVDHTINWNETTSHESNVSGLYKAQSWIYDFFLFCKTKALFFAIFVSWLEAILGFALLIGWQARFTIWMIALITIFFTFLTWYSWHYNKVTDCGCFGDALPMDPRQSFYKNVVIGALILILILGAKRIKAVFSNPFGVKFLTIVTILLIGFSLYCRHFLPVVDFLKFKEGNDIKALMEVPEGERKTPHVITKYRYLSKDGSGEEMIVTFDSETNSFTPKIDYAKYKYDAVVSEEVIAEAFTPPIHDFKILNADQDVDYIEDFWQGDDKLLLVFHDLTKCNEKSIKELRELVAQWTALDKPVWALTASSASEAEEFRHKHQISEFDFNYGDNTQLKSIIRSNPGVVLITDSTVVKKQWPSTRLPTFKKLQRLAD